MNEAIAVFRRKGPPIVFVYHEDGKDGPRPGSKGFEFSEHIDMRDTEDICKTGDVEDSIRPAGPTLGSYHANDHDTADESL